MIDTKEIAKVSELFGIRKISDSEYCGTLSSANCPVDDYGYNVLFLLFYLLLHHCCCANMLLSINNEGVNKHG